MRLSASNSLCMCVFMKDAFWMHAIFLACGYVLHTGQSQERIHAACILAVLLKTHVPWTQPLPEATAPLHLYKKRQKSNQLHWCALCYEGNRNPEGKVLNMGYTPQNTTNFRSISMISCYAPEGSRAFKKLFQRPKK